MGRARVVGLVLGAALLLVVCGGISSSELEQEAQARGGGLGQTLPLEALDAIEEATGEPVQFTSLSLSYSGVSLTVLVPGSDDELDSYTYSSNGNLLDPTPQSGVGPADELRPTLMTRDEVAVDQLDDIIDDAIERADLVDGYASNVNISRPSSDQTRITVLVENDRRDATITYRGNGDFVDASTT